MEKTSPKTFIIAGSALTHDSLEPCSLHQRLAAIIFIQRTLNILANCLNWIIHVMQTFIWGVVNSKLVIQRTNFIFEHGESLVTQTLLLTVHYDDIDTRPLSGRFITFSVDWKFLIIALMVEMGIFTALALFLKPLHSFLKLNYLLLHYILCFFSLWWMIKGIWTLFSLLFIFLWNRKPWLDNFMFIITLECSKL